MSESITEADVGKMKVDELKHHLKELGEQATGKKAELAARLIECIRNRGKNESDDDNTKNESSGNETVF